MIWLQDKCRNFLDKHSINLKKKSIVHLLILIAMYDHIYIYDIKIMFKKVQKKKKGTRCKEGANSKLKTVAQ